VITTSIGRRIGRRLNSRPTSAVKAASENVEDMEMPMPTTKRCQTNSRVVTDEKGNYMCCQGDRINDRYEVTKSEPMGAGAFGVVVEAWDRKETRAVAVKLIKARPKYCRQAEQEIAILQSLKNNPGLEEGNVVDYLDDFNWLGHRCIVFEKLSHSLYDVTKFFGFKGLRLDLVRSFAKQMVQSLKFLKEAGTIHCDLKPENVLLCNPPSEGKIKLIDFGCSCYSARKNTRVIQSMWYRAPEVILGLGYGTEVDMWSLGCILAELFTGRPCFPGGHKPFTRRSQSHDMLIRFVRILGPLPQNMVSASKENLKLNNLKGGPKRPAVAVDLYDELFNFELDRLTSKGSELSEMSAILGLPTRCEDKHSTAHSSAFVHFILSLLKLDPKKRLDPSAALEHPFLNDTKWSNLGSRKKTVSHTSDRQATLKDPDSIMCMA